MKKATFLFATLLALLSAPSYAADFIAEIDALNLAQGEIIVAGQTYSIGKSSLKGDAPNQRRSLRLSDLKAGMPVRVITRGDRINTLQALPDSTELPD